MAEAVTAYNLPRAKAWLSEDDVRRKGTQQGYVRKRGRYWHIEFYEWRQDSNGDLKYLPASRSVGPAIGPARTYTDFGGVNGQAPKAIMRGQGSILAAR